MSIAKTEPPRLSLARTPTPLERPSRFVLPAGVQWWIKRDDLTGAELSGNKVRKLEYLFAEAQALRADHVITCGGVQSNHCRATALAAARLGLGCTLLLRVDEPTNPPLPEGNHLLDRLAGAQIRWLSRADYVRRKELFSQVEAELRGQGLRPYSIPEGGSNATGAWGYVRAVEELSRQLPPGPTTIVYAAGSGGTGAGLLVGIELLGLPWRAVGINVCDDRAYFVHAISTIIGELAERHRLHLSTKTDEPAAIDVRDGYVGLGYAKSRPEELRLLAELARAEGIVLDPVYSGKAFYGLHQELLREGHGLGERIVFLHTGGIFGTLVPSLADFSQPGVLR
jgi:D-cysteine desulfhydrase